MSEADEKLVHVLFARWNRGEHTVDPAMIDPDVEIHSALARSVFRGYDGAEAWAREIDEQFDAWQVDIHQLRELDDGRFLLEGRIRGRGRQSGVDLDEPANWRVEIRDGRLLRLINFLGSGTAADAVERER